MVGFLLWLYFNECGMEDAMHGISVLGRSHEYLESMYTMYS